MSRRISIDRVELDLRGVDPALAEGAVRLLRTALEQQFGRHAAAAGVAGTGSDLGRVDAGAAPPANEPRTLANQLARRIAQRAGER